MPEWTKADFDLAYSTHAERWGHPNTRPGIRLHYHWFSQTKDARSNVAPLLAGALGLVSGDVLVLVGAGFNGTGQGLEDLGVRVIGADLSQYIQDNWALTEEAELRAVIQAVGLDPDTDQIIGPPGNVMVNPLDLFLEGGRANPQPRGKGSVLQEDLRTNGSLNAVLREFDRVFGATTPDPNWIVSERVVDSIPDNEVLLVLDRMQGGAASWGSTVAHTVAEDNGQDTIHPDFNRKTREQWRTFLNSNGFSGHIMVSAVDWTTF